MGNHWTLPDALVSSVLVEADTSLDAPPEELMRALRQWLPMGSTAKLDAVSAGRRPPGLIPASVVEQRLRDWRTSWSCWAVCTVFAAMLHAADHPVRVLGLHRRDEGAVSFDLHSALVVDEAWLVDPYLGPIAGVPTSGGSVGDLAGSLEVTVGGSGAMDLRVKPRWGNALEYRVVIDDVDAALLAGVLDVSVTHTGIPHRRFVQWVGDQELICVSEREGCGHWRRFVTGPQAPVEERTGSYEELLTDLGKRACWS